MRHPDVGATVHRSKSQPGGSMTDFAVARRMMVDGQVRTSDVTDPRILAAMLDLPRERFVPQAQTDLSYLDLDVAVTARDASRQRFLLKPMVLAKMVQAVRICDSDRVLDVGCATGYSSALLARLARSVVALEEDPKLVEAAAANLAQHANAKVVRGPLIEGWRAQAPYDVIFLNGASEIAPASLFGQLAEEGRLIGVVGGGPAGRAMLYRSVAGDVSGWPVFDAAAQVLPGFVAAPQFVF
jgi:protein-L-isoaspartate(D-aspartate) O-methyltransferase